MVSPTSKTTTTASRPVIKTAATAETLTPKPQNQGMTSIKQKNAMKIKNTIYFMCADDENCQFVHTISIPFDFSLNCDLKKLRVSVKVNNKNASVYLPFRKGYLLNDVQEDFGSCFIFNR
jgi:hypothetical protein